MERKQAVRLLWEERQQEGARFMRRVLGRLGGGAVDWIEEEIGHGEDVTMRRVTEKGDIEKAIMETNEKRFRLAYGTPPLQEPLRSELGLLGDTKAAKRILNGTYVCPPEVDPETAEFIHSLRIAEPDIILNTIPITVTKEDFKAHWKGCRERTSSSISGLHYGHYKAAAEDDYLSELHAVSTEISVTSSFSPTQWQQGLSVILEKVQGCRRPEKLRAILLMEADFNFANKLFFGYHMMNQAEEMEAIPPEISGGRRCHVPIDVALNRCLTWDAMRLSRLKGIISSVDATSCNDQMAHAIISLCTQRLGMPKPVLQALLSTIQRMSFYLRTAFGDSDNFYGGDEEDPLQGSCQGNGGGPAMWSSITIPLVEYLKRNHHVVIFRAAITDREVSTTGNIFVDDTDLVSVGLSPDEPFETVLSRAQGVITTWQNTLRATGGDLKEDKCSWGAADFEWDSKGQWNYKQPNSEHQLVIKNSQGQEVPIKRVGPSKAVKAVGVMQAMDGNMEGQLEFTLSKLDGFAEGFQECFVPLRLAWTGM